MTEHDDILTGAAPIPRGKDRKTIAVSKEFDTPVGNGIILPIGGPPKGVLPSDTAGKPIDVMTSVEYAINHVKMYGHTTIDARSGRSYQHRSSERVNSETGERHNRFSYDAPVVDGQEIDLSRGKGRMTLETLIRAIRAALEADSDWFNRATHIHLQHLGECRVIATPVRHLSDHVTAANVSVTGTYGVCRGKTQGHKVRDTRGNLVAGSLADQLRKDVVHRNDAAFKPIGKVRNIKQHAASPYQTGAPNRPESDRLARKVFVNKDWSEE